MSANVMFLNHPMRQAFVCVYQFANVVKRLIGDNYVVVVGVDGLDYNGFNECCLDRKFASLLSTLPEGLYILHDLGEEVRLPVSEGSILWQKKRICLTAAKPKSLQRMVDSALDNHASNPLRDEYLRAVITISH